jgi:hypothetical protein
VHLATTAEKVKKRLALGGRRIAMPEGAGKPHLGAGDAERAALGSTAVPADLIKTPKTLMILHGLNAGFGIRLVNDLGVGEAVYLSGDKTGCPNFSRNHEESEIGAAGEVAVEDGINDVPSPDSNP